MFRNLAVSLIILRSSSEKEPMGWIQIIFLYLSGIIGEQPRYCRKVWPRSLCDSSQSPDFTLPIFLWSGLTAALIRQISRSFSPPCNRNRGKQTERINTIIREVAGNHREYIQAPCSFKQRSRFLEFFQSIVCGIDDFSRQVFNVSFILCQGFSVFFDAFN